ncbi:MAG TPA: VOC family protein [Candidatus Nanoarchaeia archaeon]|nr:VOC family protein [Candidatus Nanoarchaeia archaeon]
MKKITPFLWFDTQAEEAMNLYVSIFKNSKVLNVAKNGDQVFQVSFELDGQQFMAINAGPLYKFTEAISFYIDCEDQAEVDYITEKFITNGGTQENCGWIKDKFGLSWQIIPKALGELMSDPDPIKSQRVMQAMLKMKKLDVEGLKKAYNQE